MLKIFLFILFSISNLYGAAVLLLEDGSTKPHSRYETEKLPDPLLNLRFDGFSRPSNQVVAHIVRLGKGRPLVIVGTSHQLLLRSTFSTRHAKRLIAVALDVITETGAPLLGAPKGEEKLHWPRSFQDRTEEEKSFFLDRVFASKRHYEKILDWIQSLDGIAREEAEELAKEYYGLSPEGKWYEEFGFKISSETLYFFKNLGFSEHLFEEKEMHPYLLLCFLQYIELAGSQLISPREFEERRVDSAFKVLAKFSGKNHRKLEEDDERGAPELGCDPMMGLAHLCERNIDYFVKKGLRFMPEKERILSEYVKNVRPYVDSYPSILGVHESQIYDMLPVLRETEPLTPRVQSDFLRRETPDKNLHQRDTLWAQRINAHLNRDGTSPVLCVVGAAHMLDLVRKLKDEGAVAEGAYVYPVTQANLGRVLDAFEFEAAGLGEYIGLELERMCFGTPGGEEPPVDWCDLMGNWWDISGWLE